VIGGLDNIEARRWLNQMIHSLVEWDEDGNPEVPTWYVDGGTEGFIGKARVVEPFKDACYECIISQSPVDKTVPLCTVKETPRQPEHCVIYAMEIEWPANFERAIDKDSPEDMQWLCDHAMARADKYGIKGVDYKLTMGVTKNIIPAIASTNALTSAACVNECIKILTGSNYRLKNSSFANGVEGMFIAVHDD
jgi:ubiquitin-activating enzyme E1 C